MPHDDVMRTKNKKQAMFDRGAEAWKRFSSTSEHVYVCPLCARRFASEQMAKLTMEHVPPRSIGGKDLVLTCEECNSTAGYAIDAAVARRQEMREFGHAVFQRVGRYVGRARITLGGIPLNAEVKADEDGVRIEVPTTTNNDPRMIEALFAMREEASQGRLPLQILPRIRLALRPALLSDLKSAYLACFAEFGYTYALDPKLDIVREQLQNPGDTIIEGAWALNPRGTPREPLIVVLERPAPALAVRLDMTTVILPVDESPDDLFAITARALASQGELQVEGGVVGWPRRMELAMDFAE